MPTGIAYSPSFQSHVSLSGHIPATLRSAFSLNTKNTWSRVIHRMMMSRCIFIPLSTLAFFVRTSWLQVGTNAWVCDRYCKRMPYTYVYKKNVFNHIEISPISWIKMCESADAFQDLPDISPYMSGDRALLTNTRWTNVTEINSLTNFLLSNEMDTKLSTSEITKSFMTVLYAWSKTNSVEGATVVERIVRRLELEMIKSNTTLVNSRTYQLALSAWANSGDHLAATQADRMLGQMEQDFLTGVNKHSLPNLGHYNTVIYAYSRSATNRARGLRNMKGNDQLIQKMRSPVSQSYSKCDSEIMSQIDPMVSLLGRMKKMATLSNNANLLPTTASFNGILAVYAQCGMARQAETLLHEMLHSAGECRPNTQSYNAVMNAWSHSDEQGSAARAESILNMMESLYEKETSVKPDRLSYTGVVLAYSRSSEDGSADCALAVLERMEKMNFPSDPYLYNLVLASFSKASSMDAATKASTLLSKMVDKGIANTISYNSCINAYAKSKAMGSCGKCAEDLLAAIESSNSIRPDVITYTSTIDAIIRSGEPRSAERAEAIVERMFELAKNGEQAIEPNTVTLNTVLHAWANSGETDGPRKAEAMLQRMEEMYATQCHQVQPTTISYTTVIDAYAKSKLQNSALDAERIFKRMEKMYASGNSLAKPNVLSFNTVMNAWALSSQPKGAIRAETILKKMISLYASGNFDLQPNVVSFSTVITAWGKSGEPGCANRAEAIFDLMEGEFRKGNTLARPNAFSYSALIDAWVKSKELGSIQHAEDIYNRLEEAYRLGKTDVIPTTILATSIIDAWSQSGDATAGDRAETLLFNLQRLYDDFKDENMRPNVLSYTATINTIAKTRQFGKAVKAQRILNRMIDAFKAGDTNSKPSVHAFTAVINACAYALGDFTEKRKALEIATTVFKSMTEYAQPNEITYGTFLKACSNLIPKGSSRDSAIMSVFRHCCENGRVSNKVLELTEAILSKDQLEKLIKMKLGPDGKISQSSLPKEWYRNVEKFASSRSRTTLNR